MLVQFLLCQVLYERCSYKCTILNKQRNFKRNKNSPAELSPSPAAPPPRSPPCLLRARCALVGVCAVTLGPAVPQAWSSQPTRCPSPKRTCVGVCPRLPTLPVVMSGRRTECPAAHTLAPSVPTWSCALACFAADSPGQYGRCVHQGPVGIAGHLTSCEYFVARMLCLCLCVVCGV